MRRSEHWDRVYGSKALEQFSWFEQEPVVSLELIEESGVGVDARLVDIGGGDSLLVDSLLARGYSDVTVLDISATALSRARERLGVRARSVTWAVSDVTCFRPPRAFDLWHDRAVFHFLTGAEDRRSYVQAMTEGLRPDGHAIIGTFSLDGPAKCSGLDVRRYSAESLARELGQSFELVESRAHAHTTPGGGTQAFVFGRFVRVS
jgi:2-polyprenyl-3-methyl-5-hydroxy-6-metoxy-1,4-benzoquinol methylase